MKTMLSVGYAVMDRIDGAEYRGGAAAGIAINGKRLGLEMGLMTVFGEDDNSREYLEYLIELGVGVSHSYIVPEATIPTNIISHLDRTTGWENDGATRNMSDIPIDPVTIKQFEAVHLASSHFTLAKRMAQAVTSSIFTYSPGPKLCLSTDYLDNDALKRSDVVFLNEDELRVVKSVLNIETPAEITKYGPEYVVTTRGALGSDIHYMDGRKNVHEHIAAIKTNVPETTGAGDAMALGFMISYLEGLPIRTCGEIGAVLAHYALDRKGVLIGDVNIKKFAQVAKDAFGLSIK